jgi:trigger factor
MVTKTINKLPKSQVEVTITVPWADIEPRWNDMFTRLAAEVEVAGFRKGQAPANMVEPRIANTLQQEVFKLIMPQALIEALQGTNVVPIDYPQYNVTAFAKGGSLVFTARVTERPVVKVGNLLLKD